MQLYVCDSLQICHETLQNRLQKRSLKLHKSTTKPKILSKLLTLPTKKDA